MLDDRAQLLNVGPLIRAIETAGLVVVLVLLSVPLLQAETLVLEAEVLEGSEAMAIPGIVSPALRYALVHHKHAGDQAAFAEWLRSQQRGQVRFVAGDGTVHQAILHRLKHCFGRGLLVFTDAVALAEKAVIRLELPRTP